MKHSKYILLMLCIPAILFVGCKKEFLDLKPIATPTVLTFYKDTISLNETVTAAYAELCAREVFDKDYYLVIGSIPADDVDCGGQNLSDYIAAQHYDQFIHTTNDATPIEEIWRYCYKGLRLANTALEQMIQVKKDFPKAINDTFIQERSSEMKFLRAWYHFTLVQVFGGVPIADKVIQVADYSKPRNSIKEVFTFIEKDLKDAIVYLPDKKNLPATQIGRATKGAAQALLCRMLMYESSYAENYPSDTRFTGCLNRYQEAFSYAEAVINDVASYSLVGLNGGTFHSSWRYNMKPYDGYRWMFTTEGDNCSESIFEIQSVFDNLGYGITRGNVMSVYQTCRFYTTPTGTQGSAGGWSFNCPTQYLIDAFRNSDARETNLHSDPGNETDDPRFATTVGRAGDSLYVHNVLQPMNLDNLPSRMIGRKFECGWDEYMRIVGTDFMEGPFNVRLIRLAEIVLLAAEAAVKTGDQASAVKYINMIRQRARNCGVTGFPKDLTTVSFEDVVHERRLELACEPHRFFDLVRWNLTMKYLNGVAPDAGTLGNQVIEFVQGKHEFWPIPISEVQISKGGLVQYPGWQ